MTTIYIDVLIILNLYVTFFLLKATARFLHVKISNIRYIIGSLFGGVFSFVILLPTMPYIIIVVMKIIMGLVIVAVVFGFGGIYRFLKNSLVFIIINMIFAGLMLTLWLFSAPMNMVYNNGYSYLDISFAVILISTAASYGLIKFIRYIMDSRFSYDENYCVEIFYKECKIELSGFPDSGNGVTDFFSGLPVIICTKEKLKKIIPLDILDGDYSNVCNIIKGFRFIPYSSLGHNGIIPIFKPDKTYITGGGIRKNVDVMIGIAEKDFSDKNIDAILNPKILK